MWVIIILGVESSAPHQLNIQGLFRGPRLGSHTASVAGLSCLGFSSFFGGYTVSMNPSRDLSGAAVTCVAFTGGSVKPLAPINVRRVDDPAGNSLIEWSPRSRLGHGLHAGLSGFDDLESEWYEV